MKIDRVELSPELSEFVAERIACYALECSEQRRWLKHYVDEYNILPLFTDWATSIGILPDGRIRQFSTDGEYEGLKAAAEFQLFMVALVHGAKSFPRLAAVLPSRPSDAQTCGPCGGTGEDIKAINGNMICECGGIGWRCKDAV